MAYFERMVHAGGVNDPRAWTYAVYKCTACNKESEFKVTDANFQTRERRCSKCSCMGAEDHLRTLETKRQTILKSIADLNTELLDIETELSRGVPCPTSS